MSIEALKPVAEIPLTQTIICPSPRSVSTQEVSEHSTESPSLFFYIQSLYKAVNVFQRFSKACKVGDKEEIVDLLSKGNTYSLGSLAFLTHVISRSPAEILQEAGNPLALFTPLGGLLALAICATEIVFIAQKVFRQISFNRELPSVRNYSLPSAEEFENSKSPIKLLNKWQKRIQKQVEEDIKKYPHLKKILPTKLSVLSKALEEIRVDPSNAYLKLNTILPLLEDIETLSLKKKISSIQRHYIILTESEKKTVKDKVEARFCLHTPETQKEVLQSKLKDALLVKQAALARRTNPWFVEEFKGKHEYILELLKSPSADLRKEGRERANLLLKQARTESNKKLLSHVIGLIAISILTTAFILFLLAFPVGILAPLLTTAGTLFTVNFIYQQGVLPNQGLRFTLDGFIPSFIKKLWRKCFPSIRARALQINDPSLKNRNMTHTCLFAR